MSTAKTRPAGTSRPAGHPRPAGTTSRPAEIMRLGEPAEDAEPVAVAGRPAPEGRRGPKLGLALGGGAARGWSHIGVLHALTEAGIHFDVVAGASIGAAVGGCFAAGKLSALETFALTLTRRRVMGLLDFHIGGSGLITGDRLRRLLETDLQDLKIEKLPIGFVAVATELGTGHEIWLTRSSLVEAVRASYALPGIFDPVKVGGRWLMDGALVNPVPVTAARALGADIVVCVNLNGDVRSRGTVIQGHGTDGADDLLDAAAEVAARKEEPRRWALWRGRGAAEQVRARRVPGGPGIASVMIDAFNITQDRISRSRLAGDPPDVMISPRLAPIGLFEFHRAQECIDLGRQAALRALPEIEDMIGSAVVGN